MDNFQVSKVAKILAKCPELLNDRDKFLSALKFSPSFVVQLAQHIEVDKLTSYQIWKSVLEYWISRNGASAGLEALKTALCSIGFMELAEQLESRNDLSRDAGTNYIVKVLESRDMSMIKSLDTGRFGSVYKVRDNTTLKKYALKTIIMKQYLEFHRNEIGLRKIARQETLIKQIGNSPNIVMHYHTWFDGPKRALLEDKVLEMSAERSSKPTTIKFDEMDLNTILCRQVEYCKVNLDTWIYNNPLDKRDIEFVEKVIILQLLEGLDYLHQKKIIHRNLKPTNIFISNINGFVEVKIGDFATAREMSEDMTIIVGVKNFRSPEMDIGDVYDGKTDVFSLGLIYLLLLLKWDTTKEVSRILEKGRLGNYSDIAHAEIFHAKNFSLLREMLSRDPSTRPSAAEAMQKLWEKIQN